MQIRVHNENECFYKFKCYTVKKGKKVFLFRLSVFSFIYTNYEVYAIKNCSRRFYDFYQNIILPSTGPIYTLFWSGKKKLRVREEESRIVCFEIDAERKKKHKKERVRENPTFPSPTHTHTYTTF